MNIERVLNGLDQLFSQHRIGDVEQYLINNMDIAKEEPDMYSYITLLNEMIGFCRDTSQYEKAVSYCKLVEQEIENQNLEGSVAHATTLLNIANAYRAASLLEESMENYKKELENNLISMVKEKEENEVKTQQAVCKLQAVVEAVSEEYEEVLCMNEKLQEALDFLKQEDV